jgi:cell wall-associated NlpC family hydrolase
MHSFRATSALAILVATCAAHAQVVIGKLGEATKPTRIYSAPSSRSRAYYRVAAYQYLVIQPATGNYFKVLLQNGTYGYAPKAAVVALPYNITSNAPRNPQPLASRGAVAAGSAGMAIAREGLSMEGTPYKWGGTDPSSGIDCSAFVQKLYGDVAGVRLPRTAAEQALVGTPINRLEDLQAGDRLYFYEAKRNKIGHTGVYLGNGWFVHSSHGKGGVSHDFLSARWRKILVAARRGV